MTSPVQPGDTLLGKYRVERVLGQGGMGVVVAARHLELGELFAIKFLLPAALSQPDAMERFLREARASARLKGEHVVKVQDVGRLPDGMPYMVMEHLAGSDLRELVEQHGPLPVLDAIGYVLQACEALAEAHSLGIVHRDLKPANMFLVRRPNGSACVKVLDFGISKQAEPEKAEQHALTRTGMVLGSPMYMSPEQMLKTKEADPRGDIWSMGVVLYQLVTGTVPFLADALTELVGKVLQEEPLPPSHHRPGLPPAVDAVVIRCLQKRREQRFQTIEQLMEALRGALAASAAPGPMPSALPAPTPAAWSPGTAPNAGPGAAPAAPMITTPGGPRASERSYPSYPEVANRTAVLPFPATAAHASSPGGGAVGHAPSPLQASPSSAALGGPAALTGQAWGTISIRQQPNAPSRRPWMFLGAALALLLLTGGLFAAWRYAGSTGDSLAAADPAPGPSPGGASATAVTPSTSVAPPPVSGIPEAPAASGAPTEPAAPGASAIPPVRTTAPRAPAPPGTATSRPADVKPTGGSASRAAPAAPPPTSTQTVKKHESMY